jgi:glycosyltransferase involved in cell wall biosynthesis
MTSFNQKKYVLRCLESVKRQDYPNLELILVDNGSSDGSAAAIADWVEVNGAGLVSKVLFRKETMPYCKSFNAAFMFSKGRYLIDLSGDDELMPDHISRSVAKLKESIGAACCFSDIFLQSEKGARKTFFRRDRRGHLAQKVKIGDVYRQVVQRYCVPSVSFVFDSEIFSKEGGYDEELSYEDFDIIVRLARKYAFVFSNHIGVIKNIHTDSFAASQYSTKNSKMLPSTLKVCWKIKEMNRRPSENEALLKRLYFETKHALWSGNFDVAKGFLELAKQAGAKGAKFRFLQAWQASKVNLSPVYALFR